MVIRSVREVFSIILLFFIAITGEMNEETEQAMMLPRCGVKDKVGPGSSSRAKRYNLQGK